MRQEPDQPTQNPTTGQEGGSALRCGRMRREPDASDLDVRDDDERAQDGHPVQEAYALDLIGVLAQLGAGGVGGQRLAGVGVDGDDDQGTVQGVEPCLADEGLQLFGSGVGEGDPGAARVVLVGRQATAGR